MIRNDDHLLLHPACLHLLAIVCASDDIESLDIRPARADALLSRNLLHEVVQAFWRPRKFFARKAGAFGRRLSGREQEHAPRFACGGLVDNLRHCLGIRLVAQAGLQRRISEQDELGQRLQVDRVLHLLTQNEFLPCLQAGPSERRGRKNIDQEILREQVGGAVTFWRPVRDGGAAEIADGTGIEIRIRDNGTGILLEIREKMFTPLFCARIDKCLALRRKKALWCNRRTRNVIKNGRYQCSDARRE